MSDKQTPILWIDLETTGTDERNDPIIEIGAVLTEPTPEFPIISEWQRVIQPVDHLDAIQRMVPEVLDMHLANGLIRDLLLRNGIAMADAETSLRTWLWNHTESRARLPLAGSGVSHFDRRFIAAQMPDLNGRLTFWAYDVGSVRRFLRLYGLPIDTENAAKTHRALDDVKAHIEEARHYGAILRANAGAAYDLIASAA